MGCMQVMLLVICSRLLGFYGIAEAVYECGALQPPSHLHHNREFHPVIIHDESRCFVLLLLGMFSWWTFFFIYSLRIPGSDSHRNVSFGKCAFASSFSFSGTWQMCFRFQAYFPRLAFLRYGINHSTNKTIPYAISLGFRSGNFPEFPSQFSSQTNEFPYRNLTVFSRNSSFWKIDNQFLSGSIFICLGTRILSWAAAAIVYRVKFPQMFPSSASKTTSSRMNSKVSHLHYFLASLSFVNM